MVNYVFQELSVDALLPNPLKTKNASRRESIMKLADSIRQYGMFTPIIVGKTSAGMQIIAGERRWRAAKVLGMNKIPAMVIEASSLELMLLYWEENVQRESLNLIEQAKMVAQLLAREGITENVVISRLGITHREINLFKSIIALPTQIQDKYLNNQLSDNELITMAEEDDPITSLH
jgi:ParB family chromosome partitioning protein